MKRFYEAILQFEPLLMLVAIVIFWFPDARRVWSLLLLIPPVVARQYLFRRLWMWTPLNKWFLVFLALMVFNIFAAPFTWGWYMLGRPVLGMLLCLSIVATARVSGNIIPIHKAGILLSLLVGLLGIFSAQWTPKSIQFQFLLDLIPHIRLPAVGEFNVNEIGGAMAWLAPLSAGLIMYPLQGSKWFRSLAVFAFVILMVALYLGQSRPAIVGVLVALIALTAILVSSGRMRRLALAAVLLAGVLEGIVFSKVLLPRSETGGEAYSVEEVAARDEMSITGRLEIYGAALAIVRDHPFTGVGLNQYRAAHVRQLYPVANFQWAVVPHTHNEILQIATDLGIPGLILYVALHVAVAQLLWQTWKRGDRSAQVVSISVAAALTAHAIFGLVDAVPLWDRFAFIFWGLLGLGAAQHYLTHHIAEAPIGAPHS